MQAQLDALAAGQKRQTAAAKALDAVQKAAGATAESVRRMSSELTSSLRSDGLLDSAQAQPPAAAAAPDRARAGFDGLAARVRARVIGQDEFVADVVKAFRRPFVMGAPGPDKARGLMLLCGQPGTGRHFTLRCVAEELAARGILRSAAVETLDLSLYPGPAQEKLFLQDLYSALQSDAEVLAFDNYEACAPGFRNMLATLAAEGTLALANRYVLQRGILVDVGTALAPGAVGELQAAGKYFVFFSAKGEDALAEAFGARFVDALAGDICRTAPFTPESLAAIAARGAEQPCAGDAPPDRPCAGDGRRRARFCRRAVRQDRRHGCDGAVSRHNAPRPGRICSGNRPGPRRRDRRGAAGGKRPPAGRRGLRRAV